MRNGYGSILESVLKYEQGQQTIVIALAVIALFAITLVAIKCFRRAKVSDRIVICIVVFILAVACSVYLLHHNYYQQCIMRDMSEGEIVVYTGTFEHDDYQKDSFYHNVYIMDASGNKMILRYPDYANTYETYALFDPLPTGTFTGTIVYSKNGGIVVDWSIGEDIE